MRIAVRVNATIDFIGEITEEEAKHIDGAREALKDAAESMYSDADVKASVIRMEVLP